MVPIRRCLLAAILLTLGLPRCGSLPTAGPVPPASAHPSPATVPATPSPTQLDAFSAVQTLEAQQAQAVSVVVDLMRAYDRAQVDGVLALVYGDVQWADCDYERESAVVVRGRPALKAWLQQRFADHDQLAIGSVTVHGLVIAVTYTRRTSDTLRARGFPNGIEPKGATKVVFHLVPLDRPVDYGTGGRNQIEYFSNASLGTPRDYCRLSQGP